MTEQDKAAGFSLEEDVTVDFNPLEAFAFDDEEDPDAAPSVLAEGPFNMPDPAAAPPFQRELVSFANGETAQARIEALFAQMPTFHKMLFAILKDCEKPIATADLEAHVEEMKRHHHSVYDPLTFADLLARAGAIEQTDETGTPLAEVEQEPLRVEVDGAEFWRVAPAPAVYWHLTADGAAQLDTYRPPGDDRPAVRGGSPLRRGVHHLPCALRAGRRREPARDRRRGRRRAGAAEPQALRHVLHRQAGARRRRGVDGPVVCHRVRPCVP